MDDDGKVDEWFKAWAVHDEWVKALNARYLLLEEENKNLRLQLATLTKRIEKLEAAQPIHPDAFRMMLNQPPDKREDE